MGYKIYMHSSFLKDAKNLKKNPALYADFSACMEAIGENPSIGDMLKSSWKGFYSFHFHRKPEMRIIYAAYTCCKPTEPVEGFVCSFGDDMPKIVRAL